MNTSCRVLACLLALFLLVLLPGCKKSRKVDVEDEGATILPKAGQVVGGGGAVQAVRGAAQRQVNQQELRQFALTYYQFKIENNRPPKSLEDVKDGISPALMAAFQSGDRIAVWNVRDNSSNAMVAYVKAAEYDGSHMVAFADGRADRMKKPEFDAALKGQQ